MTHNPNDKDGSVYATHHTLGYGANQASPGNHTHDGGASVALALEKGDKGDKGDPGEPGTGGGGGGGECNRLDSGWIVCPPVDAAKFDSWDKTYARNSNGLVSIYNASWTLKNNNIIWGTQQYLQFVTLPVGCRPYDNSRAVEVSIVGIFGSQAPKPFQGWIDSNGVIMVVNTGAPITLVSDFHFFYLDNCTFRSDAPGEDEEPLPPHTCGVSGEGGGGGTDTGWIYFIPNSTELYETAGPAAFRMINGVVYNQNFMWDFYYNTNPLFCSNHSEVIIGTIPPNMVPDGMVFGTAVATFDSVSQKIGVLYMYDGNLKLNNASGAAITGNFNLKLMLSPWIAAEMIT